MSSGKEKFYGLGRGATAGQKRNQQLETWEKSATNREPSHISSRRIQPRVRFGESVVFLAACQSGEVEEVERLLKEETADINSVNKDGLTALHQCCIDDDYEMVQLLTSKGANLDCHDNEGWTPLHAAASCGHEHIVNYLLDNGAFPAPVNNEGDNPCDLAEDDVIRDLITEAIHKKGVRMLDVKTEEERMMLADANRLKDDPSLSPGLSAGGATLLHVAAAKNYLEVLEVVLSLNTLDVDCRDEDGWTPLHAAVYWENMEAATMLAKKGASINLVTKTGDTIDDLCRPEYEDELSELKELCATTTRKRCYAVNHKRPNLLTQTSRDEYNGSSKPSPTSLRRRSSRDKFKIEDMASEKAMIEKWTPEEVADGNRGVVGMTDNIEVFEESTTKTVNLEDEDEHSDNNVKEAVNSLKDREMTADSSGSASVSVATTTSSKPPLPPGTSPQSSPAMQPKNEQRNNGRLTSPQASPKSAAGKRRPMSGQMMKRLVQWEQHSSTNLNPPPPASSSSPSGSASSSPQHTPQTTPPETTKVAHDNAPPKRFPFVPKTIPSKTDERLRVGSVTGKRNSYDEARLASSIGASGAGAGAGGGGSEYPPMSKTSSLPRNTRMVTQSSLDNSLITSSSSSSTTPSSSEAKGAEVVTTTTAMPTESVNTETSVEVRGGEGAKVERELSRGESVESLRSDRSFTEESETNRKRKAKKSRETRKKTQPVPADLFQQLSNLSEDGGRGGSGGGGGGSGGSGGGGGGGGGDVDKVKLEVERERKEFLDKVAASSAQQDAQAAATATAGGVKQSAFKPAVRPSSRVKPEAAATTSRPETMISTPEGTQKPLAINDKDVVDSKEWEEDGRRGRTKSAVRRKPREQRKPTGIMQFDPEDVKNNASEEVMKLFSKSGSSSASSPEPSAATKAVANTSSTTSSNDSAATAAASAALRQELSQLKLSQTKANEELVELRGKISELNRRLDDATRAYQQEKREKEGKVQEIEKLQSDLKTRDELKVENQRLKDENSALIRVIARLSRAPTRPSNN